MNHQSNSPLVFATIVVVLLMSALISPNERLFAQTFEEPVTVLEDTRLVNWHSDAEMNPNDPCQ